jgi:hypothetical protein
MVTNDDRTDPVPRTITARTQYAIATPTTGPLAVVRALDSEFGDHGSFSHPSWSAIRRIAVLGEVGYNPGRLAALRGSGPLGQMPVELA